MKQKITAANKKIFLIFSPILISVNREPQIRVIHNRSILISFERYRQLVDRTGVTVKKDTVGYSLSRAVFPRLDNGNLIAVGIHGKVGGFIAGIGVFSF